MLESSGQAFTVYGGVSIATGVLAVPGFVGVLIAEAWFARKHSNCVDDAWSAYYICIKLDKK